MSDVPRIERPISLVAQVEKTLRSAISNSAFRDGRLPSALQLAEQFGVSRETVRLAFEALERDGLVIKRRRRGTFVNSPGINREMTVSAPSVLGYLQADYGTEQNEPEAVTRSFNSTMLEGALVEAGRSGYSLVVRSASPPQLGKAFDELRANFPLSGIIFASVAEEKFLKRTSGLSIPSVLMDHDLNLPNVSTIRGDSMQNAELAVNHLVSQGHRQIACAQWTQSDLNPWYLRGYRKAMRRAGLQRRQAWELSVSLNGSGAFQAVDQFLAMSPRPTAIVCFNNTFASYFIRAVEQRGLAVPADISVFGSGGESVIGLTCNQLDWHQLGCDAAKILHRAIVSGNTLPAEHRMAPYQLQEGHTTAPPAPDAIQTKRKAK
jgi:DNA-binding LacI/PurR family transcriptional regulator/DNA-binding transcriptional regulator YhcF (GntR family)